MNLQYTPAIEYMTDGGGVGFRIFGARFYGEVEQTIASCRLLLYWSRRRQAKNRDGLPHAGS